MTVDEARESLLAFRRDAELEAHRQKESNLVWLSLSRYYSSLEAEERCLANQVLGEWLQSTDENLRYDALVLIDEFSVSSAIASLAELEQRLLGVTSPGTPFELAKVRKVLDKLGGFRTVTVGHGSRT
jgi:hypothetical protein